MYITIILFHVDPLVLLYFLLTFLMYLTVVVNNNNFVETLQHNYVYIPKKKTHE